MTLTELDRKILKLLQDDASMAIADVARRVGTSTSGCWRRLRSLQDAGIVQRQTVLIDAKKIGLGFTVIASVKLAIVSDQNMSDFERKVMEWPEVLECFTVSGAVDYVLRVVTTDIEAYGKFLRTRLLGLGTIADVQSQIVVTEVKNTIALPLDLAS